MRGDTQADSLETMMQKHHIYPHYTLSLPPFEVKKRALEELKKGDILLLGLDRLKLVLSDSEGICAEVAIAHHSALDRLMIIALGKQTQECASKKYQLVTVMVGEIPCRKLALGHVIGTMDLNFDHLNVVVEQKKIARGSLVNADGRIALQINEVVS